MILSVQIRQNLLILRMLLLIRLSLIIVVIDKNCLYLNLKNLVYTQVLHSLKTLFNVIMYRYILYR